MVHLLHYFMALTLNLHALQLSSLVLELKLLLVWLLNFSSSYSILKLNQIYD